MMSSLILLIGVPSRELVAQNWLPDKPDGTLRVATFNVSLHRASAGQLHQDLLAGDAQAEVVAAVIRTVRPDVLLVNELDYAVETDNAAAFADRYLASEDTDLLGSRAWSLPYRFSAAVNTGVDSELDLNANGRFHEPEDAWGYGRFPGQYGMAVLSRFEIDTDHVRTFQRFRWSRLPEALRPQADGQDFYYPDDVWSQLRLSSKSFWDVPIQTSAGTLHVLASHPTPPAFDGPEDRNGCRNHDEVRLLQAYIEDRDFLEDDQRQTGGLDDHSAFVILGDLNTDPCDGGSRAAAIQELLAHPRVARAEAPASRGGALAAEQQAGVNQRHVGPAAQDTADFNDRSVGNLRVDYVLPSQEFEVVACGVFWPDPMQAAPAERDAARQVLEATDHRLVWVDLRRRQAD